MPDSSFVKDDNRQYVNFLDAMLMFEDLKVFIGVGARFKYPKGYRKGRPESAQPRGPRGTATGSKGGQTAAAKLRHKVARIGHVWNARAGWMTETWDRLESRFAGEVDQMHKKAIQGRDPRRAAMDLGRFYQRQFRAAIQQMGLVYSGKLGDAITVEVTDAAEKARRKAAKLKRVAMGK